MFGQATGGILRLPKSASTHIRPKVSGIATRQLNNVFDQIENATATAKALLSGRSHDDLQVSPNAASWSVAQCLDHLAQTTKAFVPAITDAIAHAPRLSTNRALRTGALTQLFIRSLEPPYRLRFKVLAPLVPRQHDFNSAWSTFLESQRELAETIRCATGLAVDQVKIESPVYARFSYNIYGAFRMLAAHERRHLWQIDQILVSLEDVRKAS